MGLDESAERDFLVRLRRMETGVEPPRMTHTPDLSPTRATPHAPPAASRGGPVARGVYRLLAMFHADHPIRC